MPRDRPGPSLVNLTNQQVTFVNRVQQHCTMGLDSARRLRLLNDWSNTCHVRLI